MIDRKRLTEEFITLASMDAPTGFERPVADYCAQVLRNLGFSVEEDHAGRALGGNCGNLYAKLSGVGTPVLFSAHTDTVIPCLGKRISVDPDGTIHAAGDTVLGADDVAGILAGVEGGNFVKAGWCGCRECEDKIKAETAATARVYAEGESAEKCAACGKKAEHMVIFARAY